MSRFPHFRSVVFNLEYENPRGYANTSYINPNGRKVPLEPALIIALTTISSRIEVLA
jgi:hypothetical protein